MRAAGAGVLFISSALDEILGIADTIVVMYRGRIVCALANDQNRPERPSMSKKFKELIGEYMLGLRDDFARSARSSDGPCREGETCLGDFGRSLHRTGPHARHVLRPRDPPQSSSSAPRRRRRPYSPSSSVHSRTDISFGNMLNVSSSPRLHGARHRMAFKVSLFNLGGEGQTYAGGLAVTAVCLACPWQTGYLGGALSSPSPRRRPLRGDRGAFGFFR